MKCPKCHHYEPTRSNEQNRLLWARLRDIAQQIQWPVDGQMQYLDEESWKHILTAGLKKHQRVAAGIGGGFVMLSAKTSKMTVKEMNELQTFIEWFGAEHSVQWTKEAA